MSFNFIQKVPTKEEILYRTPVPSNIRKIKEERDNELKGIISGEVDKFIVIVGPCSADDEDALCDYVTRLAEVNEKVKEKLFIIPRIYTNKPRTTGKGYKGMLHQPDPEKAPNIVEGILSLRKMHIRSIKESGLTAADEMLYPENLVYVEDLLTYIAIGARSVENQMHRFVVSGIDVPVGMKNPTSGDFYVLLNSIYAAQMKHTFQFRSNEVKTSGNNYAHAILRGSVNKHGQHIPNYHHEDLMLFAKLYQEEELVNRNIIVDVNHSNSCKNYSEQPRIVKEILNSKKYDSALDKLLRGVMIESYIEEGSQTISEKIYGKSITDSCLGWDETEKLLYHIADKV